MAKVFIEETTLTNIGNAIRSKKGTTALIDPATFANEIESIVAGGGGGELELSPEDLALTFDIGYMFYKTSWSWFLERFGKYMSTNNISYFNYMFADNTTIEEVPFDINCNTNYVVGSYAFNGCSNLRTVPKINISGVISSGSSFDISYMFQNCYKVIDLDNALDPAAVENMISNFTSTSSSNYPRCAYVIKGCKGLRKLPAWFKKLKYSQDSTAYPYYSYLLYNNMLNDCQNLDEATDIPVLKFNANLTSNAFMYSFGKCGRLKDVTFELDNGVPYTVNWKTQTIDLTDYVGYAYYSNGIDNSNITYDKKVTNADTYNALKNDPDWWTTDGRYSRYNHDSAVATINSLPDTSAYLAEAGGTNTIKFKGAAGEFTDGGAINTLTEEEIAVATAKGWTVTLA